jgi:protein-tyrosine phosphatase
MTRILFVCHGNICRSPMAEFVFREMAEKRGMGALFRGFRRYQW